MGPYYIRRTTVRPEATLTARDIFFHSGTSSYSSDFCMWCLSTRKEARAYEDDYAAAFW